MRIILCLFVLIMSACSSKFDKEAIKELENWLQQHENNYSYCVIIPGAGCEGCISNSENLVKEYSGRSDILFVFTRIETLKLLKYKLGERISSSSNIYYDIDNLFEEMDKGVNNIYPIVCFIEKDKVIDWCYVSPEQKRDVIGELKRNLDSQANLKINLEDYLDGSKKESIVLSELVDSLEYVPLQTPEELPVDILLSVEITDNNIFVLDKQQLLYRFDRQGKFLNLIGNKGQGPKDYINVVDFDVDEKKELVYLFDNYKKRIITYNVKGEFLKDLLVPEGVINVSLNKDGVFIGYRPWYMSDAKIEQLVMFGESGNSIEVIDLSEEIVNEDTKIDMFRHANFSYMVNDCYVSVPLLNYVYKILSNNRIQKYIEIEQGKYMLPRNVASNTQLYGENLNSSYVFELQTVFMEKFVFLNFFHNMEHYRIVYDITSSKFYAISKGRESVGIVNDIEGNISFWPLWNSSDKIIGVVPSDFIEENSSDDFYLNLNSYDNPILQIAYY